MAFRSFALLHLQIGISVRDFSLGISLLATLVAYSKSLNSLSILIFLTQFLNLFHPIVLRTNARWSATYVENHAFKEEISWKWKDTRSCVLWIIYDARCLRL